MKKHKKWVWPLADLSWNTERVVTAVTKVLRSGRVTMGEKVEEFEDKFAAMVGAKYAVMTNSGSSANLLAVAVIDRVFRRLRGMNVLVPAIAWSTTYAPLQQHGAVLTVVDTAHDSVNVDVGGIEAALARSDYTLIVAASILGYPADIGQIQHLAKKHNAILWEDNCESLGASVVGKALGTFGDIGTYSTFFSHQLNTVEGGVLTTDDVLVANWARCLRAHGWTRGNKLRHRAPAHVNDYCFLAPGYNLRPTEVQAAIGLEQLKLFPHDIAERRRNWQEFVDLFRDDDVAMMTSPRIGTPVPFGFVLQTASPNARDKLIRRLTAAGIECRMVTGGSFSQHPAASLYDWEGCTPRADRLHRTGVFVGNHPRPLDKEFKALRKVLKGLRK